MVETKICRTCVEEKPLEEFYKNKNNYKLDCKSCDKKKSVEYARIRRQNDPEKWKRYYKERAANRPPHIQKGYQIKSTFGIDLDEYDSILKSQNACCAICRTDKPSGSRKYFSIDHDHATGVIRGLLCNECNVGLGMFKDDRQLLVSALTYLLKNS